MSESFEFTPPSSSWMFQTSTWHFKYLVNIPQIHSIPFLVQIPFNLLQCQSPSPNKSSVTFFPEQCINIYFHVFHIFALEETCKNVFFTAASINRFYSRFYCSFNRSFVLLKFLFLCVFCSFPQEQKTVMEGLQGIEMLLFAHRSVLYSSQPPSSELF